MDRRRFLGGAASGMGMALAMGAGFWERAAGAPVQPGASPYGPLLPTPDDNGLLLPAGFTSRIVAQSLLPVPGTDHVWHVFPDGGACVPTDDGGWIYVSNSENPPPALDSPLPEGLTDILSVGGVGAIRFSADGAVVDAYSICGGTRSNCAGGLTPWGTWLTCEEWEAPASELSPYFGGRVFECDPTGATAAVDRPALGRFKHEMATADPERRRLYLSEDIADGLFYRFTPDTWGDLSSGALEAMAVDAGGAVTWLPVADAAAPLAPLRSTVPGATRFDGGEGVVYDSGRVYLTTKGDDRVWVHDVEAGTMAVLYDAAEFASPVLNGVDNIIASAAHDLYVAEDGGNLEVCIITPDLVVAPVVRMTGPHHGIDQPTPLPLASEVTGLAFSPDGNRLYLNSQRGNVAGILYQVTGPWRGGTLAAGPSGPTPVTEPAPIVDTVPADTLPATGGGSGHLVGAGLMATAAAAVWRLRERATRSTP